MARALTSKSDDLAQYQRFRDLAAELGVNLGDEKAVELAVKSLAKEFRPPKPAKKGK
jgi:hypothetical protein